MDENLTQDEMLAIIKTVAAWNGRKIQFDEGFLKHINDMKLHITRESGVITIEVSI